MLIKKLNELKPYLPAAISGEKLPNMQPAEERYLIPVLGETLYTSLTAAYEAETLSDSQAALLDRCRAVIVPFAYVLDLPFMQTVLTDSGLLALQAENQRKAFKWEYNNVVEALQNRGYSAQEALILFLNAHREDYTEWEDSQYNNADGFAIIRNGNELSSSIGLLQPHRCYMMLRPIMESTIADLYIRPTLGDAYYTALSERIITGTLRPEEKDLVRKLRNASARLTMKHASGEFAVKFDGYGFTVVDSAIKDQPNEGRKGADDGQLIRFREEMDKTGNMLLQQLTDQMNATASAEIFAEYFASSSYVSPASLQSWKEQNQGYKGFFRL